MSSITARLKSSFEVIKSAITLWFSKPQFMWYWVAITVIIGFYTLEQLQFAYCLDYICSFFPQPLADIVMHVIQSIILLFVYATLMYQVITTLTHYNISMGDVVKRVGNVTGHLFAFIALNLIATTLVPLVLIKYLMLPLFGPHYIEPTLTVISYAWDIIIFYAIIIIVNERTHVFKAISGSYRLLKATWLQALVGMLCLGLLKIGVLMSLQYVALSVALENPTLWNGIAFAQASLGGILTLVIIVFKTMLYVRYKATTNSAAQTTAPTF
jgi:hypothetical protein